jgi:uncharacterized protein
MDSSSQAEGAAMAKPQPTTNEQAPSEAQARVVVGIDGSDAAQAALCRALEEARLRHASLEVVCAWQFPFEMSAGTFAVPAPAGEMRLWAEELIDQALASAGDEARAGVPIERLAEYGPAVSALMKVAEGAQLLVVGTRGHSRVTGLFLGSVSQYLAIHAPCPVMVVHGPPVSAPGAEGPKPAAMAEGKAMAGNGGEPEETTVASRLEEIPEEECLALLAGKSVGRLVVVHEDEPVAFPVNYVVDGHTVAVRTDPGTMLDWATLGKVAFEVDQIDEERHQGWSVLVQGIGRDVTEGVDAWSERLRSKELEPWAGGERRHWIAIASPRVSGRRIRQAQAEGSTLARL